MPRISRPRPITSVDTTTGSRHFERPFKRGTGRFFLGRSWEVCCGYNIWVFRKLHHRRPQIVDDSRSVQGSHRHCFHTEAEAFAKSVPLKTAIGFLHPGDFLLNPIRTEEGSEFTMLQV